CAGREGAGRAARAVPARRRRRARRPEPERRHPPERAGTADRREDGRTVPREGRRGAAVRLALLAAALLAATSPSADRYDPIALGLIDAMAKSGAALQSYTMTLVKRELIVKELEPEERFLVKWQRPQKIYLKEIAGLRE